MIEAGDDVPLRAPNTFCVYAATVGDLRDRRAAKKAQTRDLVRRVAQELFAERGFDDVTVADIAKRADVAAQTVFNHFATKEELFFDGWTPWVDGPAQAVRDRDASVPPLVALRAYLVDEIGRLMGSFVTPERQSYLATVNGSDLLRARERELVHEAERRLSHALAEAWTAGDAVDAPADPATAAPITAAVWLSAARVILVQQRPVLQAGVEPERAARATMAFADRLLGQMEVCLGMISGLPSRLPHSEPGWPRSAALQAG
jgi:AcrR family transcriptional regulator